VSLISGEGSEPTVSSEAKPIRIPEELYRLVAAKAEERGKQVDELVAGIVRDWLTVKAGTGGERRQAAVSKRDQKVVEERLKSLGYM
jgi:hypothetical protein